MLLVLAAAVPARAATLAIRYVGHSCFLITSRRGTRILTDPVGMPGGVLPAGFEADLVTVSHDHPDHAAVDRVGGSPRVLRGLARNGFAWQEIDETVRDVDVRSIGTFHDARTGEEQGLSSIFRFEVDGLVIVHLGDLGHMLTGAQLARLGRVDVLMVPVGGGNTIGVDQAREVVAQIKPRCFVLPMHGRTYVADALRYSIGDFARGITDVLRRDDATLRIDLDGPLPVKPLTVLLDPA